MKLSLNTQIILGSLLGISTGILLSLNPEFSATPNIIYFSGLIGSLFISLLKMILIPLVFCSITIGIIQLRHHSNSNEIWPLTLIYFLSTSALAILLGLFVVNIFKPGIGIDADLASLNSQNNLTILTVPEFLENFLKSLFVNPISAMANNQILPTVAFAIFMGIALIALNDKAKTVINFIEELFVVIMKIVQWIMVLAPVGIMCLLLKLIATQNLALLKTLMHFIIIVFGATLFHGFITLPAIYGIIVRKNPVHFLIQIQEALITAFSTSSSAATLPVSLKCTIENANIDKNIAGFILPFGATINMDGTALYEAIAAIFIANIVGIDITIGQQIIIFLTTIIAAVGAPGIPSAGMVTMIMVLQAAGLPAEGVVLLLPIDRILDSVRTMINVEGDCVGCAIINKITQKT